MGELSEGDTAPDVVLAYQIVALVEFASCRLTGDEYLVRWPIADNTHHTVHWR